MTPSDLQPHELMQRMADFFETEGIPYRGVGSMASMAYGEPRFTNDVDIVADIPLAKADKAAAPEPFLPNPHFQAGNAGNKERAGWAWQACHRGGAR